MPGVRRFENLEVWQLADELKRGVYARVDRSTAKRDFKFCDQIQDSAASAPSAIAEGFSRYHHPEFSYLLRVARASLHETQNHLRDGVDRNHWTTAHCEALIHLADRAIGAATNLLKYLDASEAPGPPRRRRR